MKLLTVVVDTNVLLVSISSKSKYHWLYKLLINKRLNIAISHEILAEYEEQIAKHWNLDVCNNVVRSLTESTGTILTEVYYRLNLIASDPDDNKFVDCAFAANADFIVTNDAHFKALKNVTFPLIPALSLTEFEELLRNRKILP